MFNPEFIKYLNAHKLSPNKFASWPGDAKVQFTKGLAQFFREPLTDEFRKKNLENIAKLQHWTDKSDFPASDLLYPLSGTVQASAYYDEGWKEIFDVMDFTGSGKGGFRMLGITSTIANTLVLPGNKAMVYNISGLGAHVDFDKYGAALEWDKVLLEDGEWLQMGHILNAFRNAAYSSMAQTHYNLIQAPFTAGKVDINWQVPDPAALANTDATYTANRDIQTINLACQTIALATQNHGYGVNPRSTFIVLTPLQLRGRIRKALGLALQAFGTSPLGLDFNVVQITTLMSPVTDHYYVMLPKVTMQSGLRLDLEELSETDILARSTVMAEWVRYGAAIGDTDQIERCNIA